MRLDNDRFYDPGFRGPLGQPPARLPGGWIPTATVPGGVFYLDPAAARPGTLGRLLARIAGNAYALGGVLLLVGATAVFLNQAPIVYQIVLGAPIFEEALKFGLALLIAYPLRFAALRLPVAWLVGAGFGWLEHVVTYSAEDTASFIVRVLFHSGATMLSMAVFHIMQPAAEVRGRWVATVPATFIHYVNNSLAVVLIPLVLVPGGLGIAIGGGVSIGLTIACYVGTVVVLGTADRIRTWVAARVARLVQQAARPGVLR